MDGKKLRSDLKTAEDDLNGLQTAQLEWAVDRETLLRDRDSAVAKQAQLEQEWQKSRGELTQEKARLQGLTAQLQEQLKAAQGEIEPLKAGREKWQAERTVERVSGVRGIVNELLVKPPYDVLSRT